METHAEPVLEPAALRGGGTVALHDDAVLSSSPPLALRLDDGRLLPVGRGLQIGTAPNNDLVLDDRHVSAVHCSIVRQTGRTLLKDMGSRNGCWLGAARVRLAELVVGARVTVGGTTFELVEAVEGQPHPMLGVSESMKRLRSQLSRVGATSLPVLLLGESGTGKELAAGALHDASRLRGALVPVNCGALPAQVVESELFGHEKGAFTGAVARRAGLFEEAEGGTLFFDEIGELPLELQPRLLRALETGMIRPVGGNGERKVNVRVVAATHRDLAAAVRAGTFRLDLYHRLAAVEIRLPSLRERREDIPVLARHFLDASGVGGGARGFSPAALAAMERHAWPGNVRQLRNAVTRAAHLGGRLIDPADLFPPGSSVPETLGAPLEGSEPATLDGMMRSAVEKALRDNHGSVRGAARSLGVPHSTLHDRVKRWGLL